MQSANIPASMENLPRVMSLTGRFLKEAGCGEHDRRHIEISVEEIFTNIASYAYKTKEGTVGMGRQENWRNTKRDCDPVSGRRSSLRSVC